MTFILWQPERRHLLSFEDHREPFNTVLFHLVTFLKIHMV